MGIAVLAALGSGALHALSGPDHLRSEWLGWRCW